jgi:pilus assembly protein CpaF
MTAINPVISLKIAITQAASSIQELTLTEFPATIGRDAAHAICLSGVWVSKIHAGITLGAAGFTVQDHGTLSGTLVNGERISEYGPLKVSDRIQVGSWVISVLEIQIGTDRADDHEQSLTDRAIHRLRDLLDLRRKDWQGASDDIIRSECQDLLTPIVAELIPENDGVARQLLSARVIAETIGLGPLEEIFQDPAVSEVMINRFDQIFVERHGVCEKIGMRFSNEESVRAVIDRIVSPLGRRIDDASPMVDARLPDGSRVNAVIRPLAIHGPCLTIRRFAQHRMGPEALLKFGSLNTAMLELMQLAVTHRLNIVVSGGTGSGKTTLLNLLSQWIPAHERLITIEDAAELRLDHENLVAMEVRHANAEGQGQITIRDLLRNSLRMRPDRIIVGECRGGEALDMLQAMNTGHEGSLTTVHANSARDALARLEVMVLMAGFDLPLAAIREQIASAVDLIIQQQRCADGRRRVVSISEVTGLESGVIQTQDIFHWDSARERFCNSGVVPNFFDKLSRAGVALDFEKIMAEEGVAE